MARVKGEANFTGVKKKKDVYIAGESFGYFWEAYEVRKFADLYKQLRKAENNPLDTIWFLAKKFKRPANDVAILIMDLGHKGVISGTGKPKNDFTMEDEEDETN